MSNGLIGVDEALERILAHVKPLAPERVLLLEALDRVLTGDIIADSNIPPFENSAMDGYAVVAADCATPPVTLRVTGTVAAGAASTARIERGTAARIMTGAPLPAGADAVVRFEQTSEGVAAAGTNATTHTRNGSQSTVQILHAVSPGDNVRRAGEDVAAGQVVMRAGSLVRPQEIGMLAALGHSEADVHRRPRVAILATGDELVGLGEPVTPGKIRNINEHSTAAMVRRCGGVPLCLGIARDRLDDLRAKVHEGLALSPDLFLTSAGVSVGDYDMVKDVLASEGHMEFWSVAIKPGKPMAFGSLRGVPLIGLPGNPVAAMVSFEQFVRPALMRMAGWLDWRHPVVRATAQDTIQNSGRRYYVRAIVTREGGRYLARATGEQGSGVLTALVRANGLMVVPEGVNRIQPGDEVDVQMLDWGDRYF